MGSDKTNLQPHTHTHTAGGWFYSSVLQTHFFAIFEPLRLIPVVPLRWLQQTSFLHQKKFHMEMLFSTMNSEIIQRTHKEPFPLRFLIVFELSLLGEPLKILHWTRQQIVETFEEAQNPEKNLERTLEEPFFFYSLNVEPIRIICVAPLGGTLQNSMSSPTIKNVIPPWEMVSWRTVFRGQRYLLHSKVYAEPQNKVVVFLGENIKDPLQKTFSDKNRFRVETL